MFEVRGGNGAILRHRLDAPLRETKPIGKSLKCQVSSVKKGKAVVWASNFTLYTSNSAEGRLYKQTQLPEAGHRGGVRRRRVGRGNSHRVVGDGVFARKTQNTVLGMCGILVFLYSGILGWCPGKRGFGVLTGIGFTGRAGRVTLGIGSVYGV